jgi:hypothetical protein
MRSVSGLTKSRLNKLAETMDNEPLEHLTNDDNNGEMTRTRDDGPPLTFSEKTTTMYIIYKLLCVYIYNYAFFFVTHHVLNKI